MRKRRRIIAILLSILFVLSVIFTLSFIAAEADHECIGDECPICAEIQSCEDFLKTVSVAAAVFAVVSAVSKFGAVALPYFKSRAEATTLVSLKVKLSN